MLKHNIKRRAFLENARFLSDTMGITPLLYGSLGLEHVTGEDLGADDIDILIPGEFVIEQWTDFRTALERNGYTLVDAHEHTFEKDGIHYAYARLEELEPFAGIPVSDIAVITEENTRFLLLSLRQYLRVYAASARDGYRLNVKEKKDLEKITLIQKLLKEERISDVSTERKC